MAMALINKLQLRALVLFIWLFVCAVGQNQLSCEAKSPYASGYHCHGNASQNQCGTFAILRTNSYYSSLFNLSFYLGISRFVLAEANGFSAETEYLPEDQLLLIPINCKCKDGFFQAELTKTTIKGESFYGIAQSLEGLTTCEAIQEKNPGIFPWGLDDKVKLSIPIRCGCPSSEGSSKTRLLLSYPVREGDTTSNLAIKFNITPEAIILANNKSSQLFRPESLIPFTSLLLPIDGEIILGPLAKPLEPNLRFPATGIPEISRPHRKKSKMRKIGLCVALGAVAVGVSIGIAAALILIQLKKKKKKKQSSCNGGDVELQQLSLSVRTTSDKKVSFEGSQDCIDDGRRKDAATPRKMLTETYTVEELRRATEDFNSSNHIEGSVYHGRLNGKNLAIKCTEPKTVSKMELELFQFAIHSHPNILRLLGTCLTEGPDSFLVFEYAKNGSLKDWLHGGLAMKNQFIASCFCFLTWSQRLRICLDVAMALHYMHHVMNPSYVHRNVKSRNIFLDEEFNAKVGNFGMARCIEDDTASWNPGYLAPEYVQQRVISPSIDIFAFGVVLLEVLSGQTPITRPKEKGEGTIRLSEKIKSILQSEDADDELGEWMDSAMGENYSFDGAVTLANLARACVEEDPSLRPSAGEAVEQLSRLVQELPGEEHLSICESSSKPLVMASATGT